MGHVFKTSTLSCTCKVNVTSRRRNIALQVVGSILVIADQAITSYTRLLVSMSFAFYSVRCHEARHRAELQARIVTNLTKLSGDVDSTHSRASA